MRELLQIGEVAKLIGVSPKTIRYYHEIGLLEEPRRTDGGDRLYTAQDLLHLQRIRRLRSLGLPLDRIKEILGESDVEQEVMLRSALRMFNVCPSCGEYSVEKRIDPSGPFAICPHCQYAYIFLQQPLFIISGASGTGKTTVCLSLISMLNECIVLEQDILWGMVSATPEDNYRSYRNVWLRIAKNIGQTGRSVVLCGTTLPEQFEVCPERRYFSTLYYLTLVCDDDLLVERLQRRPEWRRTHTPEFLEDMVQFNRWLETNAHITTPPMTLYDTSYKDIDETVKYVANWIRERL